MAASQDSKERFEQITADLPDGRDYPIVISVIPILTSTAAQASVDFQTECDFNITVSHLLAIRGRAKSARDRIYPQRGLLCEMRQSSVQIAVERLAFPLLRALICFQ